MEKTVEIPRKNGVKTQSFCATSYGSYDGYEHIGYDNASCIDPLKSDLLFLSSSPDLKSFDTHSFNIGYYISPMPCLPGEQVLHHSDFLGGLILLTNYRLAIICYSYSLQRQLEMADLPHISITEKRHSNPNIGFHFSRRHISLGKPLCTHFTPLNTILKVEMVDMVLRVFTKTGGLLKIPFADTNKCSLYLNWLIPTIAPCPLSEIFAFAFKKSLGTLSHSSTSLQQLFLAKVQDHSPLADFQRLKYPPELWQVTDINEKYEICATYPVRHIVPRDITPQDVKDMAPFRQGNRFPSIVWRSTTTGAVMVRCAQPCVGLTGSRNPLDRRFLSCVLANCQKDAQTLRCDKLPGRLLIVDARHYSAAFYNCFLGGGFEDVQYYENIEIVWKNLPNIHAIRSSFEKLILCIHSTSNQWLSSLESTEWLNNLGSLLKSSYDIAQALHYEGCPVMVHCTDGWDRTPQLTSLAQLMLDPYYRTFEGFRTLVEREWIDFGFKFADRTGSYPSVTNARQYEISPIFLQFLDCVHQLRNQFPEEFEFNDLFLIKVGMHAYSGLFGTFLCNSVKERKENQIAESTCSIWSFLNPQRNGLIQNYLYKPTQQILVPAYSNRDLTLWRDMYCADSLTLENALSTARSENGVISLAVDENVASAVDESTPHTNDNLSSISMQIIQNDSIQSYPSFDTLNNEELENLPPINKEHLAYDIQEVDPVRAACCSNSPAVLECNIMDESAMLYNYEVDKENSNKILTVSTDTLTENKLTNGDYDVDVGPHLLPHSTEYLSEDIHQTSNQQMPVPKPRSQGVSSQPAFISTEGSRGGVHSLKTQKLDDYIPIPFLPSNVENENLYEELSKSYFTRVEIPLCNDLCLALTNVSVSEQHEREIDERISQDWDGLCMIWRRCDPYTGYISRLHEIHNIECKRYFEHVTYLEKQIKALQMECRNLKQNSPTGTRHPFQNDCSPTGKLVQSEKTVMFGRDAPPCAMNSDRDRSSSESSEAGSFVNVMNPTVPEWMPNYMTNNCGLCQKGFYLFVRRHHCRNCGHIFCSECSNQFVSIPHLNMQKPQRVCNNCYAQLKPSVDNQCMSASMCTTQGSETASNVAHAINFTTSCVSSRTCKPSNFDCERINAVRSVSATSHHKCVLSMTANA